MEKDQATVPLQNNYEETLTIKYVNQKQLSFGVI